MMDVARHWQAKHKLAEIEIGKLRSKIARQAAVIRNREDLIQQLRDDKALLLHDLKEARHDP